MRPIVWCCNICGHISETRDDMFAHVRQSHKLELATPRSLSRWSTPRQLRQP